MVIPPCFRQCLTNASPSPVPDFAASDRRNLLERLAQPPDRFGNANAGVLDGECERAALAVRSRTPHPA